RYRSNAHNLPLPGRYDTTKPWLGGGLRRGGGLTRGAVSREEEKQGQEHKKHKKHKKEKKVSPSCATCASCVPVPASLLTAGSPLCCASGPVRPECASLPSSL